MSLDQLNEDMYGTRHDDVVSRKHEEDAFDPTRAAAGANPFVSEHEWVDMRAAQLARRKRIWKIVGISVAVLLVIGGLFFAYSYWKKNSFHEDRVVVSIDGPQSADSTQTVQYSITYSNDNYVALKDAEIYLDYAENFQPIDNVNFKYLNPQSSKIYVGDIKPKEKKSIDMKGIFYAPKDSQVYLNAALKYGVSGKSGQAQSKTQFGVNIATAPLILDVVAPQDAASGDSIEIVIDYKNLDVRSVDQAQVRMEYPEGFEFVSASPAPSEGNTVWYAGKIEQNQGGKIRIQGKVSGEPGQTRLFKVSLGRQGEDGKFITYNQRSMQTKVVASALAISQEITSGAEGKTVKPGAKLSYIVKFKNASEVVMRNAIVSVELSGRVLDFASLSMDGGAFDEKTGVITWKASDVPKLAMLEPGDGGEIRFGVSVKEMIPVDKEGDKNYVVRSVAKINSTDVPTSVDSNKVVGSNILELKVQSKVFLETLGFYADANIPNSGPTPPALGKETTFTIHWTAMSVSNDMENAVVTASLPSGIRWTGKTFPDGEKISYDSRSNFITWNIGTIKAGSGIVSPKREVSFQIALKPQSNQVGKDVVLLNPSTLTAKDIFVGQDMKVEAMAKDTQLREDKTLDNTGYKVVQ